jgi:hypothetical protein
MEIGKEIEKEKEGKKAFRPAPHANWPGLPRLPRPRRSPAVAQRLGPLRLAFTPRARPLARAGPAGLPAHHDGRVAAAEADEVAPPVSWPCSSSSPRRAAPEPQRAAPAPHPPRRAYPTPPTPRALALPHQPTGGRQGHANRMTLPAASTAMAEPATATALSRPGRPSAIESITFSPLS